MEGSFILARTIDGRVALTLVTRPADRDSSVTFPTATMLLLLGSLVELASGGQELQSQQVDGPLRSSSPSPLWLPFKVAQLCPKSLEAKLDGYCCNWGARPRTNASHLAPIFSVNIISSVVIGSWEIIANFTVGDRCAEALPSQTD